MDTTKLLTLLRSKFGFEAKDVRPSKTQLRILGRLPNNRMSDWLVGMHHVLTRSENSSWAVDFSKFYFIREGKIVFAWRLIFQSADDLEKSLPEICNIFEGAPRGGTTGEVMEVPLIGASITRNTKIHGKGASPIGGPDSFVPATLSQRPR